VEVHLTVDCPDENWNKCVGVITTLFPEVEVEPRNTVAIVVGPPVMYKYVLRESLKKLRIPKGNIWFSFERRMKCGVGKCGHCQLEPRLHLPVRVHLLTMPKLKYLEEAFA
jgi:sulfhydrogenase subunit gamma (sulfur reductase)